MEYVENYSINFFLVVANTLVSFQCFDKILYLPLYRFIIISYSLHYCLALILFPYSFSATVCTSAISKFAYHAFCRTSSFYMLGSQKCCSPTMIWVYQVFQHSFPNFVYLYDLFNSSWQPLTIR